MGNIDNRNERRRKTCVQAFVTDQHDSFRRQMHDPRHERRRMHDRQQPSA